MKNHTDYIYYRQLYSNQYYGKKSYVEVVLNNGKIRYLYFDKDKHIKLTDKEKYATKFSSKPKNYEKYVSYIKKKYPNSIVNYIETVVIKNKY